MDMEFFSFALLLLIPNIILVVFSISHILLNNTRPSAMLGWSATVLFAPYLGSFFYFVFGLSRVRRRAAELESVLSPEELRNNKSSSKSIPHSDIAHLPEKLKIGHSLSPYPAHHCEYFEAYLKADDAYNDMLHAIDSAHHRVALCTYIFDYDAIGSRFVEALKAAQARGVVIQVIVDGFGAMNQFLKLTNITKILAEQDIDVAVFMPPRLIPPNFSANLRNHRKLLIIDEYIVFTGGLNISQRYSETHHAIKRGKHQSFDGFDGAISDLHFQLRGQIAQDAQHIFDSDWAFSAGHRIPEYPYPINKLRLSSASNQKQQPKVNPNAIEMPSMDTLRALHNDSEMLSQNLCTTDSWSRAINDSPSDEHNRFGALFHSMIARANHRVAIITPYFIPSESMLDAFQTAALHGVDIRIYLPETLDQRLVSWARMHILGETIESGTKVFMRQGNFSHDKLFLVDDNYVFIGSPNWDPRSLLLNYESGMECWNAALSEKLWQYVEDIEADSERYTLSRYEQMPLWERLRSSLAWMASPYL